MFSIIYKSELLVLRHDVIELFISKTSFRSSRLAQDMHMVHHFVQFVIVHSLTEFPCNPFHLLETYLASVFEVVEVEKTTDTIFAFSVAQFVTDYLDKNVESNRTLNCLKGGDDLEDDGVSSFEVKVLEGLGDFLGFNSA